MIKGETIKLAVTDADATALEFRLGGPETKTLPATKTGDEWTASADTDSWTPGFYEWQAWATFDGGEKAVVSRGNFSLEPGLGIGDRRSVARKNVEAIESMLLGNAAEGVRRYKINNRELERYSVSELMQLLSYWKGQVQREERAEKGMPALGPRIAVRF